MNSTVDDSGVLTVLFIHVGHTLIPRSTSTQMPVFQLAFFSFHSLSEKTPRVKEMPTPEQQTAAATR